MRSISVLAVAMRSLLIVALWPAAVCAQSSRPADRAPVQHAVYGLSAAWLFTDAIALPLLRSGERYALSIANERDHCGIGCMQRGEERRRSRQVFGRSLFLPGIYALGLGYALSLATLVGCARLACGATAAWAAIPIVGPFVEMQFTASPAELAGLMVLGLMQATGAIATVWGLLLGGSHAVEGHGSREARTRRGPGHPSL